MRLIDLDKIDVFHQEDEDIVFDIIHATPVDAIPIEWIKSWIDRNARNTGYTYVYVFPVVEMLDDWRKENETNEKV